MPPKSVNFDPPLPERVLSSYRAGNYPSRMTFLLNGGSLMSIERNSHHTAVLLFAVAMIIAILAAMITMLERVDTRTANNETPPGTMGLAKPHPPLDRAPGQPLLGN
jgi:hypothetical protein